MKHHSISNDVSREALLTLEAFTALLLQWNRTINLVAPGDEALLWERHIADSLQLVPWLTPQVMSDDGATHAPHPNAPPLRGRGGNDHHSVPPLPPSGGRLGWGTCVTPHNDAPPERVIDLGSGAGFPGLVLAIATGVQFDLIESDQRKAAFLREAVRITGAPAQIHASRIESARVASAPLITARALAPLPKLLALAAPLLTPGGTCLFLKGANVAAELTDAAAQWHMRVDSIPSRTAPGARILRITDLSRVTSAA